MSSSFGYTQAKFCLFFFRYRRPGERDSLLLLALLATCKNRIGLVSFSTSSGYDCNRVLKRVSKYYDSHSVVTSHVKHTRSLEKHFPLDSENDCRSGCRNVVM